MPNIKSMGRKLKRSLSSAIALSHVKPTLSRLRVTIKSLFRKHPSSSGDQPLRDDEDTPLSSASQPTGTEPTTRARPSHSEEPSRPSKAEATLSSAGQPTGTEPATQARLSHAEEPSPPPNVEATLSSASQPTGTEPTTQARPSHSEELSRPSKAEATLSSAGQPTATEPATRARPSHAEKPSRPSKAEATVSPAGHPTATEPATRARPSHSEEPSRPSSTEATLSSASQPTATEPATRARPSHAEEPSRPSSAEAVLSSAGQLTGTEPATQRHSSSDGPSPPSDVEARLYYHGLLSRPRLVARSSTTLWEAPRGPKTVPKEKEVRPVLEHPIEEFWEHGLAAKIHQHLDLMMVEWTSTDVVRIGEAESTDESAVPVILWIGVIPDSLSRLSGLDAAMECWKILQEYNLNDIHVEIRESVVVRFAGPKLLAHAPPTDSLADHLEPLATTLGLPISTVKTPHIEGTGGVFFTRGGDTTQLFLLTARHVVIPPVNNTRNDSRASKKGKLPHAHRDESGTKIESGNNELFRRRNESAPRHKVTLFGDAGFQNYLASIQNVIKKNEDTIRDETHRLEILQRRDVPNEDEIRRTQDALKGVKDTTKHLKDLHKDVSTRWSTRESRIIGHVVFSPPLMAKDYYEDWAVIEIDRSKVDSSNFRGNAIDIGTTLEKTHIPEIVHRTFEYPDDRLLKLRGVISEEEMDKPTDLDEKEPCIVIFKRGIITGLTIGRANKIDSYVRIGGITSKEWPIVAFGGKALHQCLKGPFSKEGDSGSIIVDGRGRLGGPLTAGMKTESDTTDLTYATPFKFLLDRMRAERFWPNFTPAFTP